MFLIDKPFVSEFLIETIRKNKYKIIATGVAKELINDDSLEWIDEASALAMIKSDANIALYSNSENALDWIELNLKGRELSEQIKNLKDKVKFRGLIKSLFPDFYFKALRLDEIHQLSTEDLRFPFVIKPSVGFFSIGVYIVKNEEDWKAAKKELKPEKLESIYPDNVLNTNHFIIEEFIQGEEYAIDHYFDKNGNVVVLNILHHVFSSGTDTSDRVYSSSKEIITKHKSKLESFLNKIGKQLNLKNFPAHAEVKIDRKGNVVPIEINPFRFGGWCTTGDLLGITLGYNSYEYFQENKKPDFDAIFKGKETKLFSIVVLDNNSGIDSSEISSFDYAQLKQEFEHPVLLRELDINTYSVFGFVFTETSLHNKEELNRILVSDLKKYIV